MTALHELAATELVARYRKRELSPVEVTAGGARPHRRLGAAPAGDLRARPRRGARRGARLGGALAAKGEPLGPIDGVPSMIKENIATRGTPVPLGTAASRARAGGERRAAGGADARGRAR